MLHFEETCDLSGAVLRPSDDPESPDSCESTPPTPIAQHPVDATDPDCAASWYSVVDGGCWWWDFRFQGGAPAGLAAGIDGAFAAIDRSDIDEVAAITGSRAS